MYRRPLSRPALLAALTVAVVASILCPRAGRANAAATAAATAAAGYVEFSELYYDDPSTGGNGQYYFYATNNADGPVLCSVWSLGVKYSKSVAVGATERIDIGRTCDEQTVTFEAEYVQE